MTSGLVRKRRQKPQKVVVLQGKIRPRAAHNPEVVGSSPASATNIANRKRYRFGKPRNHNGFWVFYANFQYEIQKISFPQNDLWGGLELNLKNISGEFLNFMI